MSIGKEEVTAVGGRGRLVTSFLRKVASALESGSLCVVTPSGERMDFRARRPGPHAEVRIHSWRAIRRLLTGGDVGFAEAYFDGEWSTPDLTALIELGARNLDQLDRKVSGILPMRLLNRMRHLFRDNSRQGSRSNIAFHYDLGNEFYRLWLDESMTYSSAVYDAPHQTLESAQRAKLDRVVELLRLKQGASVLEIGCGWGALAARIAEEGNRVTGLTLSAEQLAHARKMIGNRQLGEAVSLDLRDYRDETGLFDRIVSIEMIEAVGERYWPDYFRTLSERLKPGGRAVLQAITIDERRFDAYRAGCDFIQRHIFPGGMLLTRTAIEEQANRVGMALASVETFGASYARTLAEWRRRFQESWHRIEPLGFDTRFRRLWEYYLCYCEAGFRAGTIDVGLYVLTPRSA